MKQYLIKERTMYKEENRDLKMGLGQCTKNSEMEIKLICLFPIPIGGLGKRNKPKKLVGPEL
jgi:hypothetical protein